ncbi:1-phosphatidylinositol 4,5-bisphosphate phosphodiesterase classes I and II-like isoform X1 [Anopheles albimanus]|uniref:1-phosphatidylinositol 4,5-bisphosphate phosphodiesterase classes I and II-like isoform X1 n=1 Tax=Anopheles albimanus TaxID=7167 RepID=UPI00163E22D5|nr:1-phosphatidylinositol 4,5-bisphosphate phosphodiesterase classes I and II-like isoform X1 [Anopheles albimanus]XP_035778858.1 1-phosphatidylinositol 4,5-bisphosphate phosphodiesterase classes I and II-like isoform X1 [Anopheles albimanus]XP_035778859.1 1-phosphatidylinositol 4,5-bisphosphate phosphodiesterase classes I and II-like isoform X1 [Anopheles albimanus]XP_035778860.1 1-phosphatidylinositol 4,5-bisphosphate phosphodiesterase classes I and II-like isoform X1 [Anopheles albimanus]XP_
MASLLTATCTSPAAAAAAAADGTRQQSVSPQSCSPRNAASPSMSSQSAGQTQTSAANAANALATNNPTAVKLGVMDVPKALQDGEKFIKWDEDSCNGTPVTLRVDVKGFFLYWVDQNHEMDMLDIATIRDVRTGQYAKKPRDIKLRQIVTMGSQDTLEEKTVTVCYGADFVNVNFINFCCTRKEIARLWCDELIRMAYNLTQLNGPAIMFLQKAYTKLCLQVDKTGKIPVKNIIKTFATNKDDRRRVEKALDVSGLPSGKGDTLALAKFQFEDFFNLYKNLSQRTEVEKVYDELVGTSKRRLMSTSQLVDFLNKTQRDPRLNEILHPYANTARARDLIQEYEPNKFNAQKGQLSFDGFLRYLMSEDNPIMAASKLDLTDDMDQPMSHYFINSSHNTYLTGHQLTGKSSVEIYRQSLLAGCRCVELDFWNGRTEEPVIVHGYTFVPEICAKDVLEAIAETAFKTSEFPVILSFENHCNPRQQAKIANYCREIFGDMLLDRPLDSHPLESSVELPAPALLKRKIIIKNKKKHHHHHHHHHKKVAGVSSPQQQQPPGLALPNNSNSGSAAANAATTVNNNSTTAAPGSPAVTSGAATLSNSTNAAAAAGDEGTAGITINNGTTPQAIQSPQQQQQQPGQTGNGDIPHHAPPLQQIRQSSKESTGSSDTDSSSDDESMPGAQVGPIGPNEADKVPQTKETEAGAEISALVNYVQPVHFSSFENSEKKARYYEMSSFDEKQATTLLKERPIEFVNYNKRQLSRVYPAGTRFDSSNFMPQLFWNAGCQLVALNYQTLDLAMQLNLGIFEYNHRCGYLLKPEFMRRKDRRLDPFAESTVDGIIAGTVVVTVMSGQFLTDKKVGTFVEVDMFGLPADTVRKKFRTKIVRDNGINPVYDEEPFVFKKVVLPELASIRIAAYEEGGKLIGHRVLPVIGLCPGYRHLTLRTEVGQPIPLATLFLCIVVKDYVPDGLSDFAEALANPIKYQSEQEKRSKQLAVLQEDTEPSEEDSFVVVSLGLTKKGDTLKSSDNNTSNAISGSSPARQRTLGGPQSPLQSTAATGGESDGGEREAPLEAITKMVSMPVAQSSLDHSTTGGGGTGRPTYATVSSSQPSSGASGAGPIITTTTNMSGTGGTGAGGGDAASDGGKIVADPLEKLFEDKQIRKKREALEKELKALRKAHDKEKLKIQAATAKGGELAGGEGPVKKSKFGMGNKLVKRFSSKNMADMNVKVPPCASSDTDGTGDVHSERLRQICREHATSYREVLEKYHEIIYGLAEELLRQLQDGQMKQLKTQLERETSEVMRQLQLSRKSEVKQLAMVHKDKDELERMKREVDSTLVEKGVTERVRLTASYERKRDELQRQHDAVKQGLEDHKQKARSMLEKEAESHAYISDTFLAHLNTSNSTTSCSSVGASSTLPPATTTSVSSGNICAAGSGTHESNVNNTHLAT